MLALVEAIAASDYARGVFATTSMHTLVIAQTPLMELHHNVLRVNQDDESLVFEYVEEPAVRTRWTRRCAASEGFACFERFVRAERWFLS